MTTSCPHEWINDPMFESGAVVMEFNFGQEMRQYCKQCGAVQYVPMADGDKR